MLTKLTTVAALAALSLVAIGCAAEEATAADTSESAEQGQELTAKRAFYTSAKTAQALDGNLERVTPAVRTADPGHSPEDYLSPSSALGASGPLGAWGPLGALGPIGDASWNVSSWMSAAGDWNA